MATTPKSELHINLVQLPPPLSDHVSTVIHMSDLHIRVGDVDKCRYHDYIYLFQQIDKFLATFPPVINHSAIVVFTGDMFDSKNRLDAHSVLLFNKLIETITRWQLPFYLICGNHDLVQSEMKTPDLLTSLLYRQQNPWVYYLNRTGHYLCRQVGIGLVEIRDAMIPNAGSGYLDPAHLPPFPDADLFPPEITTKIALFHGMIVSPSQSDERVDHGVPLNWIKRAHYHCALLGDLHRRTFDDSWKWEEVDAVDVKNAVDTNESDRFIYGYAGSMIQNNFGEPYNHHGCLIWDLDKKEVRPINFQSRTLYLNVCYDPSVKTMMIVSQTFKLASLPSEKRIISNNLMCQQETNIIPLDLLIQRLELKAKETKDRDEGKDEGKHPLKHLIIKLKGDIPPEQINQMIEWIKQRKIKLSLIRGLRIKPMNRQINHSDVISITRKTKTESAEGTRSAEETEVSQQMSKIQDHSFRYIDLSQYNTIDNWIGYLKMKRQQHNVDVIPSEINWQQWFYQPRLLLLNQLIQAHNNGNGNGNGSVGYDSSLTDYIKRKDTEINSVIDEFEQQMKQMEKNKKEVFILQSMSWDYILCYGPGNYFNFELTKGKIAMVTGANSSGKSSFVETILIGLYGDEIPSRKDHMGFRSIICSSKPDNCPARIVIRFSLGHEMYQIERTFIYKHSGSLNRKVSLKYFDPNQGQGQGQGQGLPYTLISSSIKFVNQWVEQSIGRVSDLLLSCLLTQSSDRDFFDLKDSEQIQLFDDVLHLSTIDKMTRIFNTTLKGIDGVGEQLKTLIRYCQNRIEHNHNLNLFSHDNQDENRSWCVLRSFKTITPELLNQMEQQIQGDRETIVQLEGQVDPAFDAFYRLNKDNSNGKMLDVDPVIRIHQLENEIEKIETNIQMLESKEICVDQKSAEQLKIQYEVLLDQLFKLIQATQPFDHQYPVFSVDHLRQKIQTEVETEVRMAEKENKTDEEDQKLVVEQVPPSIIEQSEQQLMVLTKQIQDKRQHLDILLPEKMRNVEVKWSDFDPHQNEMNLEHKLGIIRKQIEQDLIQIKEVEQMIEQQRIQINEIERTIGRMSSCSKTTTRMSLSQAEINQYMINSQ